MCFVHNRLFLLNMCSAHMTLQFSRIQYLSNPTSIESLHHGNTACLYKRLCNTFTTGLLDVESSLKVACRMHLLFLFISFGLVLSVPLDWQWEEWKLKHGKSYKDEADENHRKNEWTRNYHYILQHNRQDHLFKLGLNEFADMVRKFSW